MAQHVSRREIELNAELASRRDGTFGLVQCPGCRYSNLVRPARPDHLDECECCPSHCQCFRVPDGIS